MRSFINQVTPYLKNSAKQKELEKLLVTFICKTFQPLHIVDLPEFKKFVLTLNLRYTLIGRKTLTTKLLPMYYDSAKNKLMNLLEKANSIAMTTDCWTSCSNESFLGITVHF